MGFFPQHGIKLRFTFSRVLWVLKAFMGSEKIWWTWRWKIL